ncbi:MAG: hypothetical protein ABEK00_00895 [Candidatus Nanohaloarchaea archaeon]
MDWRSDEPFLFCTGERNTCSMGLGLTKKFRKLNEDEEDDEEEDEE